MNKINNIFAMHSIEGFAGSLVSIFIPIYFLSLDYSLSQIFIYYIIFSLSTLLFFFVSGKFANSYGLKKNLLVRYPFLFLYIFFLYQIKSDNNFLFYSLAIISSIQTAFYWFPLHYLFAYNSEEKNMGESVSKLSAIPQFISIFAPLLGGLITSFYGFKSLFIVALLIYISSFFPLLMSDEIKTNIKLDLTKIKELYNKYKRYFFAEIFENIGEEIEIIILPIFIYLTFKNIFSIGAIGTLLGLGGAAFTYFIGKKADKSNKKNLLKIGAGSLCLVWLSRYFINNEYFFYIASLVAGFMNVLVLVPFGAMIYSNAKKENIDEFIIFREIPVVIGRVAIYSICLLLVSHIKLSFFAAVFSFLLLFFY